MGPLRAPDPGADAPPSVILAVGGETFPNPLYVEPEGFFAPRVTVCSIASYLSCQASIA